MVATDPKVRVNWLDHQDISLTVRTVAAPGALKFYLPVYTNVYRCKLIGIFAIEVHSQEGHDINVRVGEL